QCVVTVAADSGPGTLRECITWANANPGRDTITFNIPGPGVKTINLASPLPEVTESAVIDGYAQPRAMPNTLPVGNNANLLIELNGNGVLGHGLAISASNTTVKGLVINRFGANGIALGANGRNVIQGNFIGTDVLGTADRGNSGSGVFIDDGANNTIGGTAPAERNLISGNDNYGVAIRGAGARSNLVQGNYIGTNAAGSETLGKTLHGLKPLRGPRENQMGRHGARARDSY